MAGQRPGQLLVAQRFVVAGHGKVSRPTVAARQGPIGDLTDERLDELVLAALRRGRVAFDVEDLAAHQVAQPRLELVLRCSIHRGQRIDREDLAQHRGFLEQAPIRRVERVETRRDERAQRVRHRYLGQIPDRDVRVVAALDASVGQQPAHHLDRVQR
jgi:hypothetical protein